MDWTSGGAAAALIGIRAAHFGATALVSGALLFRGAVAGPSTRSVPSARAVVDGQARRVAATALAASIVTGVAWFVLTAAEMANVSLRDALDFETLSTIAEATQFGTVAMVRIALAIVVGAALAFDPYKAPRTIALGAALGLMASIAWSGHGGSGLGADGDIQLTADVFHLLAASAWIGGLVPLALLLSSGSRSDPAAWAAMAHAVTRRFSVLGIVSVATLIVSGAVNAWFLVGSLPALVVTEYGRVLMMKLLLFLVMLAFATVNRNMLTPRLAGASDDEGRRRAIHALTRNCMCEIALGLAVLTVVGWLGTLHPAAHFMN